MRGPPKRVALAWILAVCLASASLAGEAERSRHAYRGRPLREVLEEFQRGGLNLIYSSEVVRADLVVADEPEGETPRAILDEILAPLGLRASDGVSGSILITPAAKRGAGKIAGRVVESARGRPVGTAALAIEGTSRRTVTHRDGTFALEEVPPGSYVLRASAPGFLETVRADVIVDVDATVEVALALAVDPRFVDDIVVTPAHHELIARNPGAVRSLDQTDVSSAPVPGGDPSRIVTLLPGVAAADGSAAFNARGGASRDVSLVLDGLELREPFHLSAFRSPLSLVDGRMVDAIDFVSGGFTADRGDRHGGFVEISSIAPADTPKTELDVGTTYSRVAYDAPTAVGPLLVSGRYWYPEAAGDTIPFGADGLKPTFGDLYVKLGFLSTPTTALSGHALVASDRATLTEQDGNERVAASNADLYFWIRALRSWAHRVATETVVSAGRTARFHQGVAEPEVGLFAVQDRRNVRFVGVKNDAAWTIDEARVFRAGVDLQLMDATLDHAAGPPGAESTTAVAPAGAALGAYIAYRSAIGGRLVAETGLRWDRQTYTGDRQWSPRLNLVWQAGPRSELRLGVGRFAQSQRLNELRIEDGETTYAPPEICEQLDLTYIQGFSRRWNLRADAYLHRFGRVQPRSENLFHPFELFPEVEPDRVLIAPESARLRGVELSVSGTQGPPLQWMVNYTWSSATDAVSGVAVPRSWDQTHAGNVLVAYGWRSGWFLSANGTVHTGWPTTPVTGRAVTLPDGSTEIEPVLGPRNSARFPTYARLDVKTGRRFQTAKGDVRLELSILNLTDRENVCCVDEIQFQARPDGGIETLTSYDTWMGITPSFQVLWSF